MLYKFFLISLSLIYITFIYNYFRKENADLKNILEQVQGENSKLNENVQQMHKDNTDLKSDLNNFKCVICNERFKIILFYSKI